MLVKPAIMLLGLINQAPKGAYEITKMLRYMNVKRWFNISDSTIYTTLKNLEKKDYINGKTEKNGNMPERTVYSITETGKKEYLKSLRKVILTLEYDTTTFSIAATFIEAFEFGERVSLLEKRIEVLNQYLRGINGRIEDAEHEDIRQIYVDNIIRMKDIVETEIAGAKRFLETINSENKNKEVSKYGK